jgi:hypothetical protein
MVESLKHEPVLDVIELAMSRLAHRSPESAATDGRKEREKLDLGRRGYDLALAKRLEQLQAMDQGAHGMPPAPAPEPAPQHRCLQTGILLALVMLSVAAGAGVTWLATRANPEHVVAPAAVVAPVPVPSQVVEAASIAPAPIATDEDQVRKLIENWRSAWAGREVDAYLACYVTDFTPANGQTHDVWTAARRKNIATRSSIIVAINDLKLERFDAQRMTAHFLQNYASGNYRETAQPKTLLLVRGEAGWQIAGEWQGEAPASAIDTH